MARRPIFEEVTEASARATPARVSIERPSGARRAIRAWLYVLFALVVAMIAVGGLTRLTGSGLSITDWRPVTGAIPPLNAEDWAREFDAYRQIDQYQLVNRGMTLGEFQFIYWWEWGHRQLGRFIGLVWGLGFLWFWLRGQIPPGWTGRLLGLGALGGAQGAIGWWMVASGLNEGMVAVASYRLAVHLGLAFVILGLIAWYALLLARSEAALIQARRGREAKLFSMSTGLMHFAFLQIILGALVAGIDAGRGYTDWPLMAGQVFPPAAFELQPLWRNFFENDGLVQFIHRTSGYLLAIFAVVIWARGRRSSYRATRAGFNLMLGAMAAQIVLGIVTVLHGAPWPLAIAHQLLAVVLFVIIIRARFLARYPYGATIGKGRK
ncbi:heme A synthase [Pararhodobacter sp.]|uniref:heme A synthase n=1 Tax=Pararhodobacter sp. TaxID=2127056 RepID=UPI002FDE4BDE